MSNEANLSETAQMLSDHGLSLREEPPDDTASPLEADDDELEFQPIQRTGLHWLTLALIGLLLWGGGFLVGVLVDRALAG
ncbi:MAG: hypothetical protein ACOH1Y_06105 [Propionicimonas sp.]